MKKLILLLILLFALTACDAVGANSGSENSNANAADVNTSAEPPRTIDLNQTTISDECSQAEFEVPENRTFTEAANVLVDGVDYYTILCTDAGAILIDLYEEQTPITVNNFVFLAQNNYYNVTIFHRVLEGFMAQGGDPTGTGRGGPGYQFEDEIVEGLEFDRSGLLAMANAGAGTNGSQFFITFDATPHLNGAHTIFGEVVQGTRVLNGILRRDPNNANAQATGIRNVMIVQLAES